MERLNYICVCYAKDIAHVAQRFVEDQHIDQSCVITYMYGKYSKILNTFLILFSNKMLMFRAGIHRILVRIAIREDPDQTASSEAV